MTLMETVIALALIGVVIPIILASTAGSLSTNRESEADTRAAVFAAEFRDDLAAGWKGEGQYFDTLLSYPDFGGDGDIEAFAFFTDGAFKARITDAEYQSGVRDAAYIVRVSGESHAIGNPVPRAISRVTISVESPAIAPRQTREVEDFITLAANPDP